MKKVLISIIFSVLSLSSIAQLLLTQLVPMTGTTRITQMQKNISELKETTFRFPCGDSIGTGYYIAQGFQDPKYNGGTHLGIDINGLGGGDSDLGDTIYSIGNGIVARTAIDETYLAIYYKHNGYLVKTIYYHCKDIFVTASDYVYKGKPIATIGNENGVYLAHLHLEIASDTTLYFGAYGDPEGYLDPLSVLPFKK